MSRSRGSIIRDIYYTRYYTWRARTFQKKKIFVLSKSNFSQPSKEFLNEISNKSLRRCEVISKIHFVRFFSAVSREQFRLRTVRFSFKKKIYKKVLNKLTECKKNFPNVSIFAKIVF